MALTETQHPHNTREGGKGKTHTRRHSKNTADTNGSSARELTQSYTKRPQTKENKKEKEAKTTTNIQRNMAE